MEAAAPRAHRRRVPLELNLLPVAYGQRPIAISVFSVALVLLALALAYAVFPFTAFSATADLPNLYSYMSDQKAHVAGLEDDLAQHQATLSNLYATLVPQAQALEAQIAQKELLRDDMTRANETLFTYFLWSAIIEEIDDLTPAGVRLTSIAQDKSQVIIEGVADTDIHISDYAHAVGDSDVFRGEPPDDPDIEWTYQLIEKEIKLPPQTPQRYHNWPDEAMLTTSGTPTPGVEYWAVIVGVADYPGITPDLNYSDDDARDVGDALLASTNWKESNIAILIDGTATKANIQAEIIGMGNNGDADDAFFFFFSGHGDAIPDQAPLDEADGDDETLCQYDFETVGGITDDELGDWLAALPGGPVMVAIDTCHSGGMIKAGERQGKGLPGAGIPQRGDGFARDLDGVIDGVVLTSCDDDEVSYEAPELKNGLFTYYFVEGLEGPADTNGNDEVTMEEAFYYLKPRVIAYCEEALETPYSFIITVTRTPREGGE